MINSRTGKTVSLTIGKLMFIKLLDVYVSNKGDSKFLGYALVQLSDRMRIYMNIFKNQQGHLFLKFPNVKVGEEYKSTIEFINLNLERDISNTLSDDVAKRLHSGHPTSGYSSVNAPNEFPF